MKKVLVVITTGFVKWGGLTNAFMNYYRSMDKTGLLIDVASMNLPEQELVEEIEENGGKYIKLPDKRKKPINYLRAYNTCCKKYDVVHIHGNSATVAGELTLAMMNGVKIRISHCHTNKCMHPILNALCTPFMNMSATVSIAVSEAAGKWLYKNKDYIVLNNAIDSEKYSFSRDNRKTIRDIYEIKDGELLFGHVGKIYEAKNHDFLVDLFKEILMVYPNAKLLLVGDGVLRHKIETKVAELGLIDKIIFAGMQSETYKYYSAIDIFLFPSLYEGFPLAVLEAQANGLPVIASENVPSETNISKTVVYKKLIIGEWIRYIENMDVSLIKQERDIVSNNNIELIKDRGFDCYLNSSVLKEIYLKGMKKNG